MSARPAGRGFGRTLAKIAAWVVGLTLVIAVLFTWVFPWMVEIGFDPTLGG